MFKQALRLRAPHNLTRPSGVLKETIEAILPEQYSIQHRQCSNSTSAKLKWDLFSAVCVERHPIIVKPMEDIEARFYKYVQEVQFENSLKSDYEIRCEKENEEQMKKKIAKEDTIGKNTTKDFENESLLEKQNFKFGPLITESDMKNDTTSLDRKLEKSLLLLTKQRIGETEFWIPPQGQRQEGETMRQTAERVLQDTCGINMTVSFYGNAPIGVYKYRYPKAIREQGTYGAKIFFFLAKYMNGNISNEVKHQWLDREELAKTVHPQMHKSLSLFLISS